MFKPEDGIPIRGPWKGYTAAVRLLQPGQSVYLPIKRANAYAVTVQLELQGERKHGELVCRTEGNGSRVWRR